MPKAPTKSKALKNRQQTAVLALANRTEPADLTPMNFKVPASFHREFKLYAVQNGMSMVDLLQESFKVLKKTRA